MKNLIIAIIVCSFLFTGTASAQNETEEITLTTYYPAPYGDYDTIGFSPSSEPAFAYRGLIYYDNGTDLGKTEGLYFYNSSSEWRRVGRGSSGWNLSDDGKISTDKQVGVGLDPILSTQVKANISLVTGGHVQIGPVSRDTTDTGKGGAALFFSGGGAGGAWGSVSENSDPLFIQRWNRASDRTDLRINIGDNYNSDGAPGDLDRLVIGALTDYNDLDSFEPVMTVDSGGTIMTKKGNWTPKTFVIDHPADSDKYLVHGTLEGPENAVYYRGSSALVQGMADIDLPAYFELLTNEEGITIQITNINGFDILAVKEQDGKKIKDNRFVVFSNNTLSSQKFDWEVKAIRNDVAPLNVEPAKDSAELHGYGPYTYLVYHEEAIR